MTEPNRPPPRRITVTSPRTRARPGGNRAPARREIDEQTQVGQVYMHTLLRAQLRLAMLVCLVSGLFLGGLPLLFALSAAARSVRVLGLPLPWLLLGVLVYPLLVAGAWLYIRAAERNERDFAELVERS